MFPRKGDTRTESKEGDELFTQIHQEKFGSRTIGREKLQQLQKHSKIVYIS